MNFLFVTAALGSSDIQHAAKRLVEDAEMLGLFQNFHVVLESEILGLVPQIVQMVPQKDWSSDSKFGYYVWKPQIARLALSGHWGQFDGVMYLDAGCEILASYWTRKKLMAYMQKSIRQGAVVFDLSTKEYQYTKSQIFGYFPDLDTADNSGQIQSGSWLLSGAKGKELAEMWAKTSSSFYADISGDFDPLLEVSDFVVPRHDQSFFSLTCKTLGIHPERESPPGGGLGLRTQWRSLVFPFRWARNRTGTRTNFYFFRALGSLSLGVHALFTKFQDFFTSSFRPSAK